MADLPRGSASCSRRCPYTVLGVERGASPNTIKKAFRRKALLYHPDKQNKTTQNATQATGNTQEATPQPSHGGPPGAPTEPSSPVPSQGASVSCVEAPGGPTTGAVEGPSLGATTGAPNPLISGAPSGAPSVPPSELKEGPQGGLEGLTFLDLLEAYEVLTVEQKKCAEDKNYMSKQETKLGIITIRPLYLKLLYEICFPFRCMYCCGPISGVYAGAAFTIEHRYAKQIQLAAAAAAATAAATATALAEATSV